jgi:hypothetical protein
MKSTAGERGIVDRLTQCQAARANASTLRCWPVRSEAGTAQRSGYRKERQLALRWQRLGMVLQAWLTR